MGTEITVISTDEAEKISPSFGAKHFPRRFHQSKEYIREENRLHSLGAGALLYCVLGISEQDISYNPHQKPFIINDGVHFNLSHSGKYVVLATDENEVGVDIEMIRPVNGRIAQKVFQPEELLWMKTHPEEGFFELWTLKESVMKQQGLGFSLSPDSFSVLPLLSGGSITLNETVLYASLIRFDDHIISVCTVHPQKKLTPRILEINRHVLNC